MKNIGRDEYMFFVPDTGNNFPMELSMIKLMWLIEGEIETRTSDGGTRRVVFYSGRYRNTGQS